MKDGLGKTTHIELHHFSRWELHLWRRAWRRVESTALLRAQYFWCFRIFNLSRCIHPRDRIFYRECRIRNHRVSRSKWWGNSWAHANYYVPRISNFSDGEKFGPLFTFHWILIIATYWLKQTHEDHGMLRRGKRLKTVAHTYYEEYSSWSR